MKCAYHLKREAVTILDGDAVCEECIKVKFQTREILKEGLQIEG